MSVIIAKPVPTSAATVIPFMSMYTVPAISMVQNIPSGDTLTIDGIDTTDWRAAKWQVLVTNSSKTKTKGYEIFANHTQGVSSNFTTYGISGDRIFNQIPNVIIDGSQLVLQITNNEVESITVYVTRFAIPAIHASVYTLPQLTVASSNTTVLSGATTIVDWITGSDIVASKWYITITDSTGRISVSQLFGLLSSGANTIDCSQYGYIGDRSLQYTVDVVSNGSIGLQVLITNHDNVPYKVDLTRIPIYFSDAENLPSSVNSYKPDYVTVLPSLTNMVDTCTSLPGYQCIKWLISVVDVVTNETTAFEFNCTQTNPTLLYNIQYGSIGTPLQFIMSTELVGNNVELYLTNNQPNDVIVNAIRIPMLL